MSAITLTPAYGRDYKSRAEALAAYAAGMDFLLHGKPINRDYVEMVVPHAEVRLRYDRLRRVAIVPVRP
jgi:hypothetical protein